MTDLRNQEYNLGKQRSTTAMNTFVDMTNEGFRQVMNGLQSQKHKKRKVFWEPLFGEIPSSVVWRGGG